MLLVSTALIIAFMVPTSLIIYRLCENPQDISSPSLGSVTGTYSSNDWLLPVIAVVVKIQPPLLERVLMCRIVSNVRLRCFD